MGFCGSGGWRKIDVRLAAVLSKQDNRGGGVIEVRVLVSSVEYSG